MTPEEQAEIVELITRIRGLAMGFAAIEREELERLERAVERSAEVIWYIDPTTARNRGGAINRHVRLIRAAARFAKEARAILEEELEELRAKGKGSGDAE